MKSPIAASRRDAAMRHTVLAARKCVRKTDLRAERLALDMGTSRGGGDILTFTITRMEAALVGRAPKERFFNCFKGPREALLLVFTRRDGSDVPLKLMDGFLGEINHQ
jgi:hypothetical protein